MTSYPQTRVSMRAQIQIPSWTAFWGMVERRRSGFLNLLWRVQEDCSRLQIRLALFMLLLQISIINNLLQAITIITIIGCRKMHKKSPSWDQKSLKLTQKQSHNDNLIGLCLHSENTFLTSSEDKTVRLWDLRTQSSVKLIRNQCLVEAEELSNPACEGDWGVFVGAGKGVYRFDMRKQAIFVEEVTARAGQPHYDSISQLKYSPTHNQLACCDDQGDIRTYNPPNLSLLNRLEQEHTNICNSVEWIDLTGKGYQNKKVCVSGGYDSTVVVWDVDEERAIKKVPVLEILGKYGVKTENQNYPFVHAISAVNSSVLVSLESGYVLCLPVLQPRKPKFMLQASLTRVTDSKVRKMGNKNLLLTCAIDDSFSIFDYEQREGGCPKFLQKYKTVAEPVQVEVLGKWVLVVGCTKVLSFYEVRE